MIKQFKGWLQETHGIELIFAKKEGSQNVIFMREGGDMKMLAAAEGKSFFNTFCVFCGEEFCNGRADLEKIWGGPGGQKVRLHGGSETPKLLPLQSLSRTQAIYHRHSQPPADHPRLRNH